MKTSPAFALLRLIRPKQWIKNFFVFAPLIFAKELFSPGQFLLALRATIAFCFASSAIYVINDIVDAPLDRAHPQKRFRPIAAGVISVSQALILFTALVILLSLFLVGMDLQFIAIVALYAVMNLLYSFKLKDVVLLDVFIIAAGFMLRVLGGAVAINVQVSSWLVLCSLFISLFLGFAKRRGELVLVHESGIKTERRVLKVYKTGFLDQMLTIAAAGAVISYALYSVSPRTIEMFGTDKLIYTTILVCYGVFRYLLLIHTSAATENPTNAVTSDPPILITGFLWILACILIIYSGREWLPLP